jgi:hypothetical protein
MTAGEIATAAFGLAVLQVRDDGGDDNATYEMLALLALESLAMLRGRDPAGFGTLLNGLALCAQMRSTECLRAALARQPPSPRPIPRALHHALAPAAPTGNSSPFPLSGT